MVKVNICFFLSILPYLFGEVRQMDATRDNKNERPDKSSVGDRNQKLFSVRVAQQKDVHLPTPFHALASASCNSTGLKSRLSCLPLSFCAQNKNYSCVDYKAKKRLRKV